MKTSFVFVFVVAVLALANAESVREQVDRFKAECNSANAITPHLLCMNVKFGVMKSNGDIDRNEFKAALEALPAFPSAAIDDAVAECGERRGSTAADSALSLNECLRKHINRQH